LGCPLERLRQHLCALGEWDDTRHAALVAELEQQVNTAWKMACTFGTMTEGPKLDPGLMFEDVYETLPPHLARQREALRTELAAAAATVAGHNEPAGDVGPMGYAGHMVHMGHMDKGA
jgi:2-oxoisovalerate dehydrogenase E1 component alpha subunit